MSQKSDDEQLNTNSTEKDLVKTNSIGRDPQVLERGRFVQSNEQIGVAAADTGPANHSSDLETGPTGVENLNESEANSFEKADKFDDVLNNELADFDEDMEPVTTQENSTTRRRLRMVLDFEDDDEE